MKKTPAYKILFSVFIITLLYTPSAIAQPAGPGDGSDPFATPVNSGVAFAVGIAFLYGIYRIIYIQRKKRLSGINN